MKEPKSRVRDQRLIHQGTVFSLFQDQVILPNGKDLAIDVIRHPGAAAIVALKDPETVLLLRQYRYAVEQYLWEVPAGTLAEGENPLQCAKRELLEETGFDADNWEPLGRIIPLPAYSDEIIHIFLAHGLTHLTQALDQDEILKVHAVPLKEIDSMIMREEIKDSKSISALTLARLRLAKGL